MVIGSIKSILNNPSAKGFGFGGFPLALIVQAYEVLTTLTNAQNNIARQARDGILRMYNWRGSEQLGWKEMQLKVFYYVKETEDGGHDDGAVNVDNDEGAGC